MKRILICGSRDWTDPEPILRILKELPKGSVVIHGGARGADSLAGKLAQELGFKVEVYMADWKKYGKAAGPERNSRMLEVGKPDECYAFPLNESRGTWDMIRKARAVIPTFVYGKKEGESVGFYTSLPYRKSLPSRSSNSPSR